MNIFLSTSFSGKVNEQGKVVPEYKALVEDRLRQLRGHGHKVFCVIEQRNWQMPKSSSRGGEVGFDVEKVRQSDAIVAICGKEVSAGLQWECGFMTGLGRPVYVWREADQVELPCWNQGLIDIGDMILIDSARQVV